MEEDKKRKGSIVAGEEVKVNENENKEKIGVSDTIEIATINEKESDKILDENVNKDNINGIKDEDKKEIKEDKNAKKELKKNKDGKKKINKQLLAVVRSEESRVGKECWFECCMYCIYYCLNCYSNK